MPSTEELLAETRRQNEALLRLCDAHKQRADFAEQMLRRWMQTAELQAALLTKIAFPAVTVSESEPI